MATPHRLPEPMRDLRGGLCDGRHELFDSLDLADHRQALALCRQCPVFRACYAEMAEILTEHPTTLDGHSNLSGTWAGVLYGRRGARPAWMAPLFRPSTAA